MKRARFAVKELARLKKCLGMVDETGKDILEKVADISTITDVKEMKQVRIHDFVVVLRRFPRS